MKKKLIICSSIGIFILGVCLSLFVNKKKIDNNEETASVPDDSIAEIELEAAEAETTEVYFAGSSEETGDTVYALYLEDEAVRNNSVFHAFVNKEIAAYDEVTELFQSLCKSSNWCKIRLLSLEVLL